MSCQGGLPSDNNSHTFPFPEQPPTVQCVTPCLALVACCPGTCQLLYVEYESSHRQGTDCRDFTLPSAASPDRRRPDSARLPEDAPGSAASLSLAFPAQQLL